MHHERIPIDRITPNPDQPRKVFDLEKLQELAASIEAVGLEQPISVRPVSDGRYEIVAGERRWRAHKLLLEAGKTDFGTIDAIVRNRTIRDRDIAAIIENLQRVDVSPLEEANAFARLKREGMAEETIAKMIGVPPFRVRWRLQLLELAPQVRSLFERDQLDKQQAMEIARLPDHEAQIRTVQMINRGQLQGWKAVRNAVETILEGKTQADIFGEAAARGPSSADVKTLTTMEAKIEQVSAMVARGWSKGECVIACRVNPDRAAKMADQIAAIGSALRIMERELRNAGAQVSAVLDLDQRRK